MLIDRSTYKVRSYGSIGTSNIVREKSILEPLFCHELPSENSKGVVKKFSEDVYMLFNQKRLEKVGIDTVNAWISSLTVHSDSLDSLRSKCTDEQLLSLVKSRWIQSPSELLAWSKYLEKNCDAILAAQASRKSSKSDSSSSSSDTASSSDTGSTESSESSSGS